VTDWAPEFFRQNTWANLALIEACRSLTDEQLDAAAPGVYGSIRATLLHILDSEASYAQDLHHEPRPPLLEQWPGFDALAEMATATGDSLVAACRDQTGTIDLAGEDGRFEIDPAVILAQAFHHSTEHRSQINTILTGLGVEAVDLSGWRWGFDTERMRRR